jgi:hypothetical protein
LERSATLTPSPERRAERALAAATAKYHVGAFDAALGLLAAAEAGPMDELQRARCDLLRGRIAFASSRGSDAPPLLLKAARRFEPLDLRLARDTYLLAMFAAMFAGSLAGAADLQEVAEAARASPPPPPPCPADLLLDGIAVLMTEGYPAGAPMLTRAVSAFRAGDPSSGKGCAGYGRPAIAPAWSGTLTAGRYWLTVWSSSRVTPERSRRCRAPSTCARAAAPAGRGPRTLARPGHRGAARAAAGGGADLHQAAASRLSPRSWAMPRPRSPPTCT